MQAEGLAAVLKRERGTIDFAAFGIEDLSAGPLAAVLRKSPEHLKSDEGAVFQGSGAKVAGGMGNGRVEEGFNGSVKLSVLLADGDDRLYFAGCVIDGLPSADRGGRRGSGD